MAQVAAATPGDALSYGIEMNVGANYRNTGDGFYAGVTWGVLWPLAALERTGGVRPAGTVYWQDNDVAGASAAQILRAFFGIRF